MRAVPAWQLVLHEARRLSAYRPEFTRAELIDAIRLIEPDRQPGSLGPVIQGMTRDATGGPPSPCGTPLVRVSHGHYRLAEVVDAGAAATQSKPAAVTRPTSSVHDAQDGPGRADISLIGCVKTKLDHPAFARDLYQSPLFTYRRGYAERTADRYFILSAEHGLVHPDTMLEPYDTALAPQSATYRRAWGQWVVAKLLRIEQSLQGLAIDIHAGEEYAAAISPLLVEAGADVRRPLASLSLGQQLSWYLQNQQHSAFPIVRLPTVASEPDTRGGLAGASPLRTNAVASSEHAVVAALLRYGREHRDERAGTEPTFTPHPEANTLLLTNPFAFLVAVLFDQGIPAERAWRAPYDLQQRLGHLEPARIVAEPDRAQAAVAKAPALHRYVNNLPRWLVSTARIVLDTYEGDAGRIWAGEPRAADLNARLRRIPGIGQKKAAMAVEILARDMGVQVQDLSGSDIAYDVHVRRVFLRTQLAEDDDLDHMVEVARSLHPERPGELDFPAWLIGRRWCGPGQPNCGSCPLATACPKDVQRAERV